MSKTGKTCPDCGCEFSRLAIRCETCQRAHVAYRLVGSGQALAQAAVTRAKRKGQMKAAAECSCIDCGAPAKDYEHRDYDKPLEVVPVCRSCNGLRGPAKRKSWTFDEFFAYFTTLRRFAHFQLSRDDFKHIRAKYWPEEVAVTHQ